MANKVYIATSIDGYIADENNSVDWLAEFPASENDPDGFTDFMETIDALIMGRNTFEAVVSFGLEIWPYTKPVYVISKTMKEIPEGYQDKAYIVQGSIEEVLSNLQAKGHNDFYIDGGKTIQSFLEKDLIDEMTISTVPVVLGKGSSLFGNLNEKLNFELIKLQSLANGIVAHTYMRKNEK